MIPTWLCPPQILTLSTSRCSMCQSGLNLITSGSIPLNRSSSSSIGPGWSWINYPFHPLLSASPRKTTTKILGVTITDTLSFSPHITDVIARCSQTSYALRILRAHGLNGPALWNVTRSTLISKLLYASPVWFGYLDKESRDQCRSLLNRLKRWGFLGKDFDNFITLCENADDVLFSALLLNENHVLHQLLPPVKCTQYNLRNRPHNYTLPKVNNNYIKNNFMFRMLYKNIY